MFCQTCGAQNTLDARFCNMCGAGLTPPAGGATVRGTGKSAAAAKSAKYSEGGRGDTVAGIGGTAGAPADRESDGPMGYDGSAPAGPPMGYMPGPYDAGASSVSLQAIGVQSSGRTWAFIGGMVVLLLLLGGAGGWLASRGEKPPAPVVPPDAIAAPMEIGTPHAVGEETPSTEPPPNGVESPTSGSKRGGTPARPGTALRTPRAGSGGASGGGGAAASAGGGTGGAGSSGAGGSAASGGAGGSAASGGAGGSAASGGAGGSGSGGSSAASDGTGTGGNGGTVAARPSGDAPNTVPLDEPEQERDLMLDLYSTQVRRFIRTYYATRAQGCFDHASRNNEGIRGTVVVTFTIAADGTIPSARATRNTTGDEALGGCLVSRVRAWDLPDPPGGELELAMPFSR